MPIKFGFQYEPVQARNHFPLHPRGLHAQRFDWSVNEWAQTLMLKSMFLTLRIPLGRERFHLYSTAWYLKQYACYSEAKGDSSTRAASHGQKQWAHGCICGGWVKHTYVRRFGTVSNEATPWYGFLLDSVRPERPPENRGSQEDPQSRVEFTLVPIRRKPIHFNSCGELKLCRVFFWLVQVKDEELQDEPLQFRWPFSIQCLRLVDGCALTWWRVLCNRTPCFYFVSVFRLITRFTLSHSSFFLFT